MPKLQKILNMAIGIRTLVPESTITKMQSRPFGFCKLGQDGLQEFFTGVMTMATIIVTCGSKFTYIHCIIAAQY